MPKRKETIEKKEAGYCSPPGLSCAPSSQYHPDATQPIQQLSNLSNLTAGGVSVARYIAHHVSNTRMCCQSHCVGCWPGVQRRLWGSVANQSSSAVGMTLRAASREDPARPWDTFRLLLPSLARLPRSGCAGLVWRARLQTDGRDTKEEDKKRELERRTPGLGGLDYACYDGSSTQENNQEFKRASPEIKPSMGPALQRFLRRGIVPESNATIQGATMPWIKSKPDP
ncbi:hypothetical protein BGZ61DRAFT_518701 [Ilyonectria robusta]|uniref:uncharacterized protein n=1 Tax=Ilyonectria robusta TaxID=1079257 RepID=UPI001E8E09AE|nr:uncharacterized protein BGZ61DRAFT_518701 [Ilyonectria robusta]KAH8686774.1 hypothetical protein BGZ61DRAFT_518701 [Ilyonectria robusta]